MIANTLTPQLLPKMGVWRASNDLSVGWVYLCDNPFSRTAEAVAHEVPLMVGPWGTTQGQNFFYMHLNRIIKEYDLDMFYIAVVPGTIAQRWRSRSASPGLAMCLTRPFDGTIERTSRKSRQCLEKHLALIQFTNLDLGGAYIATGEKARFSGSRRRR